MESKVFSPHPFPILSNRLVPLNISDVAGFKGNARGGERSKVMEEVQRGCGRPSALPVAQSMVAKSMVPQSMVPQPAAQASLVLPRCSAQQPLTRAGCRHWEPQTTLEKKNQMAKLIRERSSPSFLCHKDRLITGRGGAAHT